MQKKPGSTKIQLSKNISKKEKRKHWDYKDLGEPWS